MGIEPKLMTILEAIATGKRFKRPSSDTWRTWAPRENMTLIGEDITAKDYHVEEPHVSIDRENLLAACNQAGLSWGSNNPKFLALCVALGL